MPQESESEYEDDDDESSSGSEGSSEGSSEDSGDSGDSEREDYAEKAAHRKENAESEKQKELLKMYQYTVSKAGADTQWSELKTPGEEAAAEGGGFMDMFFGSSEQHSSREVVEEEEEEEEEKPRKRSDTDYWKNYDISASLSPYLVDPKKYAAATKIAITIRAFLAQRSAARKRIGDEVKIMEREVSKIKKVWRGFLGRKKCKIERGRKFEDEKDWRAYDDFRLQLKLRGYKLLRWSHSKKILVPCTLRVDQSREFLVLQQSSMKSKKYRLKDVNSVLRGCLSPFLLELEAHKTPEKSLSLLLRDSQKGGKEISVDLMFDTVAASKNPQAGNGKFLRNKFYKNFLKLQLEIESEEAFFFNTEGFYCRVGKSVFDRWEHITLINPEWAGEGVEDEERKEMLKRRLVQQRPKAARRQQPGCFEPHPIPLSEKPQNNFKVIYLADKSTVAACWHSETVGIEFGSFNLKYPTIRKEKYTLQRTLINPRDRKMKPRFYKDEGVPLGGQLKEDVKPSDPVPVPLGDLKPFFENEVKRLYGDIGISGWRNRETKDFDFADDAWNKLCNIATKEIGTKRAMESATSLRKIMNGYDILNVDVLDVGYLMKATGTEIDRGAKARKDLLKVLWKEQKEGKMYRASDRSFNTAQKKKLEGEKHKIAMASQERIAKEAKRLESIIAASKKEEEAATPAATPLSPASSDDDPGSDGFSSPRSPRTSEGRPSMNVPLRSSRSGHHAESTVMQLNVSVLETSKRALPLGVIVVKCTFHTPFTVKNAKGKMIVIHQALGIQDVVDKSCVASIQNAWQNNMLHEDDYIIGVGTAFPESLSELVQLLGNARKARHLNLIRPPKDFVCDEEGDEFRI